MQMRVPMAKQYVLSATLLVAGCASPYGMNVNHVGQLPTHTGQTVQIGDAADPVLTERVMAKLASRGFTVADPADYLVQIVSSDLPAKTGAFLPERATDASGKRAWLMAPSRKRKVQTRRVIITLTDVATGSEIYRAAGDERYRAGKPGNSDALIEAVVAQIAEQQAISSPAASEEEAT